MDKNNPDSDEGFYCSDCGKEVKPNDEICPNCGVGFDKPSKKLSDLELSRVDEFSRDFYFEITKRHPEWDKYARVLSYKYPKGECFYLSIEIPSPEPQIFPIEITSGDDEPEELTIYFGHAHFHMGIFLRSGKSSLIDQLNGIEKITRQIFDEELIAIQKQPGFFFVGEGMVTREEYKKMLDKEKLRRAASWRGTYNYPKDGTHGNWNP